MTTINVTVDDFDPLVRYSNYDDWATPNPQDNPTWWNASQEVTGSPWHEATYHYTTVQGAYAQFNYTGKALYIYGATGPGENNYTVTDGDGGEQAFQTANATGGDRTLLFSTPGGESAGEHTVQITNWGSGLLLDVFVVPTELGAEGSTVTNTTLDDRAPEIQYTGSWTQQEGPNFHDQTSTYTSGPGNAFELNFTGSAVWIYGDQVNDHGEFTVSLNGTAVATHTGRSGCGGGFAKACEKLHGLAFFAGYLPPGTHALRLENGGPSEGNQTFFDFDYLEYAVPSVYASDMTAQPTNGTNTTLPSAATSASPSAATSASPSATLSGAAPHTASSGSGVLGLVLAAWVLRALF